MCPVHIAFFRRRSQMKYYPPVNGTTGLGCHCLQARFLRCFFRVKLSFSFSSIHFESVLPFFAKHIKKKKSAQESRVTAFKSNENSCCYPVSGPMLKSHFLSGSCSFAEITRYFYSHTPPVSKPNANFLLPLPSHSYS